MPAEPAAVRGRQRAGDPGRERRGRGRRSSSATGSPRPGATSSTARGPWSAPATRSIAYDARGHGESDPAPAGEGYGYPELVGDLERVVAAEVGEGPLRPRRALDGRPHRGRLRAAPPRAARRPGRGRPGLHGRDRARARSPTGTASPRRWRRTASTASSTTSTGSRGSTRRWRDSVLRFTRERMLRHRHPEALAEALREVPRSRPFGSLDELERARGAGPGRRQPRRRRPRPSLRGGRRLRGGAAAGAADQRGARASRRSPGRAASSRAR